MTRPAEAAARGFDTMGAVRGHLLLTNCLEDELTRPNIELAMKEDRLLWLDLQGTDDEVLILLREVFKIHPLAVEDVKEFHQRPKIEDYDDFVSIVAYGARGREGSLTAFLIFGIGTEALAVSILFVMFRRRGWLGKGS
jgi:Mg2+ and Co2+ transporter CorA